jgi:hypothetical protein
MHDFPQSRIQAMTFEQTPFPLSGDELIAQYEAFADGYQGLPDGARHSEKGDDP